MIVVIETLPMSLELTGVANNSASAVMGNVDSDGELDIYVANNGEADTLWINQGGDSFLETTISNVISSSNNAVMGDIDNDGDLDIYVANGNNEKNNLWINDGIGSFSAGTVTSGTVQKSDGGLAAPLRIIEEIGLIILLSRDFNIITGL